MLQFVIPEASVHLRNLNRIKQDLYILEINLSGTSASTSIRWEELGFIGEDLEEVKASEAKLANIPLFKALKTAGSELTAARNQIYHKMIRAEGRTACTAEKLPEIWVEFQQLQQLADQLRADLAVEYEDGLQEFLERITHLLANKKFGLNQEDVFEKIERITTKFPHKSQLDNYLTVKIGAFELIPSLESQLSLETNIANAEAQKMAARNQVNAERIVSQIQAQQARDIQKLRQELIFAAKSECYEMVAKLVSSLANFEPGSSSKRLKKGLKNHTERLEALLGADIDGTLTEVFDKFKLVSQTVQKDNENLSVDRRAQLQQEIDALKASLEADQKNLLSGSDESGLGKSTVMRLNLRSA
jgi:hypothetical protein